MFDLRNCKKSEISNSNCLELTEELLNKIAPKSCVSQYTDIYKIKQITKWKLSYVIQITSDLETRWRR